MLIATLVIAALAAFFGLLLGYAAVRFRVEGNPVADQIESVLPQTHCGQCGFPGCRPYAEAVAGGAAEMNLCIPGGAATVVAIAELLGRDPVALEGEEKGPAIAYIDPERCIGCTLCMQTCPVDAIVGAARQLHGALVEACTGCELCLPPCPVECISMVPLTTDIPTWRWPYPAPPRTSSANSAALASATS